MFTENVGRLSSLESLNSESDAMRSHTVLFRAGFEPWLSRDLACFGIELPIEAMSRYLI
jgi:hypothetical protein